MKNNSLISTWILVQILLVIVFGIVPSSRRNDLGDDLLVLGIKMLLLHFLRYARCDVALLGGVVEDGGAVFWSRVRSATRSRENDLRVPVSPPCLLTVVGSCVR